MVYPNFIFHYEDTRGNKLYRPDRDKVFTYILLESFDRDIFFRESPFWREDWPMPVVGDVFKVSMLIKTFDNRIVYRCFPKGSHVSFDLPSILCRRLVVRPTNKRLVF